MSNFSGLFNNNSKIASGIATVTFLATVGAGGYLGFTLGGFGGCVAGLFVGAVAGTVLATGVMTIAFISSFLCDCSSIKPSKRHVNDREQAVDVSFSYGQQCAPGQSVATNCQQEKTTAVKSDIYKKTVAVKPAYFGDLFKPACLTAAVIPAATNAESVQFRKK